MMAAGDGAGGTRAEDIGKRKTGEPAPVPSKSSADATPPSSPLAGAARRGEFGGPILEPKPLPRPGSPRYDSGGVSLAPRRPPQGPSDPVAPPRLQFDVERRHRSGCSLVLPGTGPSAADGAHFSWARNVQWAKVYLEREERYRKAEAAARTKVPWEVPVQQTVTKKAMNTLMKTTHATIVARNRLKGTLAFRAKVRLPSESAPEVPANTESHGQAT